MGRSSTAAAGSTEKVTPRRGARKLGRRALAPVLWAPVLCPQVFLALFLTWFRGQWRSGLRKDRPLRKSPAGDVLRRHPESALAQACYRGLHGALPSFWLVLSLRSAAAAVNLRRSAHRNILSFQWLVCVYLKQFPGIFPLHTRYIRKHACKPITERSLGPSLL